MAKFRKRPVVIEAVKLTEELAWDSLLNRQSPFPGSSLFFSGTYHPKDKKLFNVYVPISTPEGRMRAEIGDWIIKGVQGEFYPCKPDIFEETYEAIE
jgi:hypothetical protein